MFIDVLGNFQKFQETSGTFYKLQNLKVFLQTLYPRKPLKLLRKFNVVLLVLKNT